MLAKEIERSGIPAAQITAITRVALMAGSNRIIPAKGIVHPTGNANLSPVEEKDFRRSIVLKALEALQTKISEQQIFALQ